MQVISIRMLEHCEEVNDMLLDKLRELIAEWVTYFDITIDTEGI